MSDKFLIILSPPRSFSSVVSTMIGQHPQLYGFPELHLFIGDTVQEVLDREYRVGNFFGPPGVIRAIAELVFGCQTNATVIKAIGWLAERRHWSTKQLMDLFREMVHPKIAMEKSPITALKPLFIERAHAFYPDACYLHLTRHPVSNRKSLIEFREKNRERHIEGVEIPTGDDPVDDLLVWYRFHKNILDFTRSLPVGQSIRLRGEDVLSEPDAYLPQIAEWLGVRTDREAIAAMKRPEASHYAFPGPAPVPGGNDRNFMRSPRLRPGKIREPSLHDFLERTEIRWVREDRLETMRNAGFRMASERTVIDEIRAMSQSMGYL
jgi:hypothetical protein